MEAFGGLAAGIAHDFNNLLTAILGFSELLLGRDDLDESVRHDVEEIHAAGDSAASLTQQLLAFSRKQMLQPQTLDLNQLVDRMKNLLRRTIGEDIQLTTKCGSALGLVSADPGQIDQVVLNLAVNARDAMPTGGCLAIETANVDLDDRYCRQHPEAAPGSYVMLTVTDTGAGMTELTLGRLFEPFFTTKARGKGTGLGLPTVQGIVRQSGGTIDVSSRPGHGTTFRIYLPRIEGVLAGEPAKRGSAMLDGTETVLIVDDQAEVRAIERACLERHGYTVLEASAGDTALRLAAAHKGVLHLLLTDVVMPGMSGADLARALVRVRPAVRVLYASGYSDAVVGQHGVSEPAGNFIQKPFTSSQLLRRMRDILDR
jgi:CheY-like chemotaxis protein